MNDMLNMLFQQDLPTKKQSLDVKQPEDKFEDAKEDVKDEDEDENNDEDEDEDEDEEDEEQEEQELDEDEDEEEEQEQELDEDDEDEEEEQELDEDEEEEEEEEEDEDEDEEEVDHLVYVLFQDDIPLMYSFDLKEVRKSMNYNTKLYLSNQRNSFLRTEKTYASVRIYERYAFSFYPFQDSLSTVFSIVMVPRIPF